MVKIEIAGREIPLVWDMTAWVTVEDEVCAFTEIRDVLFGKGAKSGRGVTKLTVELIRILGNEGLLLNGGQADLTNGWLLMNIRPARFHDLTMKVIDAFAEGMEIKVNKRDPHAERDLVLEEVQEKKAGDT